MGLNQPPEPQLLSETQVTFFLLERAEWSLVDGALRRTFSFPGLIEAVAFVGDAAVAADQAGCRPEITIRDASVTVTLGTSEVGGPTLRDTGVAARIDDMFALDAIGEFTGP